MRMTSSLFSYFSSQSFMGDSSYVSLRSARPGQMDLPKISTSSYVFSTESALFSASSYVFSTESALFSASSYVSSTESTLFSASSYVSSTESTLFSASSYVSSTELTLFSASSYVSSTESALFLATMAPFSSLFVISLRGLSCEELRFDFEIPSTFMSRYSDSLVQACSGELHVLLHKSDTLLDISMLIDCVVDLKCDRTLRSFSERLQIKKQLWAKYSDHLPSSNKELIILPHSCETLCLDQDVYDYISLSIPIRRLHPDYRKEEEEQSSIANDLIYSTLSSSSSTLSTIDSPWQSLRNLHTTKDPKHGTSEAKNLKNKKR